MSTAPNAKDGRVVIAVAVSALVAMSAACSERSRMPTAPLADGLALQQAWEGGPGLICAAGDVPLIQTDDLLNVGEQTVITLAEPADAAWGAITWVTNGAVATTTALPETWRTLVTAVGAGQTCVEAKLQNATGATRVGRVKIAVPGIRVSPPSINEVAGGSTQLSLAAAVNADGSAMSTGFISWSSSDGSVAAVDPFGLVLKVAAGTATITASFNGQSVGVPVTLRPRIVIDGPNRLTATTLATFTASAAGCHGSCSTYTWFIEGNYADGRGFYKPLGTGASKQLRGADSWPAIVTLHATAASNGQMGEAEKQLTNTASAEW